MKILFSKQAFEKLRAYITGIEYEISGFGKVEKKDGDLYVTDVKIFQQVVSGGHTEMDRKALALFWDELLKAHEDTGLWKLWWHSHVFMSALFSGTDLDTISEFDAEVPEDNWMMSIVANKLGKMLCRIDVFEPIRCTINDVPWEIEVGEEVVIDVKKEIEEQVQIYDPSHREEESEGKIMFPKNGNNWPILPPMMKDGKPLSYLERLKAIREMGITVSIPTEVVDISLETP